ncbi:MAG TPA: S-adenosylmethionine:tRNA ribosyltransferase-isomerase, partial [Geobacterales bacterium]|nr:S-adenosylmethionine:tRNA ribosyltransferase-isomerase [Geobacterales bacterium]
NDLSRHRMHREQYFIPPATATAIAETKRRGGRVIAVGTTTTRALEHAAQSDGSVRSGAGEADIFILPGYGSRVIDALVTNFHLPGSTLLLLVAAFAGADLMREAYSQAMERQFRFYSYGDAMFIV